MEVYSTKLMKRVRTLSQITEQQLRSIKKETDVLICGNYEVGFADGQFVFQFLPTNLKKYDVELELTDDVLHSLSAVYEGGLYIQVLHSVTSRLIQKHLPMLDLPFVANIDYIDQRYHCNFYGPTGAKVRKNCPFRTRIVTQASDLDLEELIRYMSIFNEE